MILLAAVAAGLAAGLLVPGTGRGLARLQPLERVERPELARSALRLAWPRAGGRRIDAERARVVEFAAALAAEVRAGRPPRDAVVAAVDGLPTPPTRGPCAAPTWSEAARGAAVADGSVDTALDRGADGPGAEDLRDVAACWRAAEQTGAGLGTALEEVAGAAGERSAHRARVRAQLAGVRTTGWLLATLPLLGILLGAFAGARPWEVLLGSARGFGLLLLGLLLDAAGVAWLCRMARRVEALG